MISISCLESKLLNNNNWYGRFQLAPFQKGEGLTVANALRRTLLAEKSNFYITWVDFYNAEIPYSVLTGMRESIFDILLNLKQVVFTSDVIGGPDPFIETSSPTPIKTGYSDNNLSARPFPHGYPQTAPEEMLPFPHGQQNVLSPPRLSPQHSANKSHEQKYDRVTSRETSSGNFLWRNSAAPNQKDHLSNNFGSEKKTRFSGYHCFSQGGALASSKGEISPVGLLQRKRWGGVQAGSLSESSCPPQPAFLSTYGIASTQKNGRIGSHQLSTSGLKRGSFPFDRKRDRSTGCKSVNSTYTGSICVKGPARIYAKNIRLPKGLKCVDPDKYIVTLADDGLFYLRFSVTGEIRSGPARHWALRGQRGPWGLTQWGDEVPFRISNSSSVFDASSETGYPAGLSFNRSLEFNSIVLTGFPGDQEIRSRLAFSRENSSSLTTYIGPRLNTGSVRVSPTRSDPETPSRNLTNKLIRQQRLLLTNDSIKQCNFQSTSITANIQKTSLLNVQVKHYYYKCARFDRFLFDLIRSVKPDIRYDRSNWPLRTCPQGPGGLGTDYRIDFNNQSSRTTNQYRPIRNINCLCNQAPPLILFQTKRWEEGQAGFLPSQLELSKNGSETTNNKFFNQVRKDRKAAQKVSRNQRYQAHDTIDNVLSRSGMFRMDPKSSLCLPIFPSQKHSFSESLMAWKLMGYEARFMAWGRGQPKVSSPTVSFLRKYRMSPDQITPPYKMRKDLSKTPDEMDFQPSLCNAIRRSIGRANQSQTNAYNITPHNAGEFNRFSRWVVLKPNRKINGSIKWKTIMWRSPRDQTYPYHMSEGLAGYKQKTDRDPRSMVRPDAGWTIKSQIRPIPDNSVVLKPIYLNVEQIIYVLKQSTRFHKNQRVDQLFFDSVDQNVLGRIPLGRNYHSGLFKRSSQPAAREVMMSLLHGRVVVAKRPYKTLFLNSQLGIGPHYPIRCLMQMWPVTRYGHGSKALVGVGTGSNILLLPTEALLHRRQQWHGTTAVIAHSDKSEWAGGLGTRKNTIMPQGFLFYRQHSRLFASRGRSNPTRAWVNSGLHTLRVYDKRSTTYKPGIRIERHEVAPDYNWFSDMARVSGTLQPIRMRIPSSNLAWPIRYSSGSFKTHKDDSFLTELLGEGTRRDDSTVFSGGYPVPPSKMNHLVASGEGDNINGESLSTLPREGGVIDPRLLWEAQARLDDNDGLPLPLAYRIPVLNRGYSVYSWLVGMPFFNNGSIRKQGQILSHKPVSVLRQYSMGTSDRLAVIGQYRNRPVLPTTTHFKINHNNTRAEPYSLNVYNSKISYTLRYTYPFKYTISETILQFLFRGGIGQGDTKNIRFDGIQSNESYKIYTNLAYPRIKRHESEFDAPSGPISLNAQTSEPNQSSLQSVQSYRTREPVSGQFENDTKDETGYIRKRDMDSPDLFAALGIFYTGVYPAFITPSHFSFPEQSRERLRPSFSPIGLDTYTSERLRGGSITDENGLPLQFNRSVLGPFGQAESCRGYPRHDSRMVAPYGGATIQLPRGQLHFQNSPYLAYTQSNIPSTFTPERTDYFSRVSLSPGDYRTLPLYSGQSTRISSGLPAYSDSNQKGSRTSGPALISGINAKADPSIWIGSFAILNANGFRLPLHVLLGSSISWSTGNQIYTGMGAKPRAGRGIFTNHMGTFDREIPKWTMSPDNTSSFGLDSIRQGFSIRSGISDSTNMTNNISYQNVQSSNRELLEHSRSSANASMQINYWQRLHNIRWHRIPASWSNTASKWRILNSISCNDAFIIVPFTWPKERSVDSTPSAWSYPNWDALHYTSQAVERQKWEEKAPDEYWDQYNRSNAYRQNGVLQHSVPDHRNTVSLFNSAPMVGLLGQEDKKNRRLAVDFENVYYKNFLWNSRKITLRILTDAILPPVADRKWRITRRRDLENTMRGPETQNTNQATSNRTRHFNETYNYSLPTPSSDQTSWFIGYPFSNRSQMYQAIDGKYAIVHSKMRGDWGVSPNFDELVARSFFNTKNNSVAHTGSSAIPLDRAKSLPLDQSENAALPDNFMRPEKLNVVQAKPVQHSRMLDRQSLSNIQLTGKKLPSIIDLWTVPFFCMYSLYAISTESDQFLQNLISTSALGGYTDRNPSTENYALDRSRIGTSETPVAYPNQYDPQPVTVSSFTSRRHLNDLSPLTSRSRSYFDQTAPRIPGQFGTSISVDSTQKQTQVHRSNDTNRLGNQSKARVISAVMFSLIPSLQTIPNSYSYYRKEFLPVYGRFGQNTPSAQQTGVRPSVAQPSLRPFSREKKKTHMLRYYKSHDTLWRTKYRVSGLGQKSRASSYPYFDRSNQPNRVGQEYHSIGIINNSGLSARKHKAFNQTILQNRNTDVHRGPLYKGITRSERRSGLHHADQSFLQLCCSRTSGFSNLGFPTVYLRRLSLFENQNKSSASGNRLNHFNPEILHLLLADTKGQYVPTGPFTAKITSPDWVRVPSSRTVNNEYEYRAYPEQTIGVPNPPGPFGHVRRAQLLSIPTRRESKISSTGLKEGHYFHVKITELFFTGSLHRRVKIPWGRVRPVSNWLDSCIKPTDQVNPLLVLNSNQLNDQRTSHVYSCKTIIRIGFLFQSSAMLAWSLIRKPARSIQVASSRTHNDPQIVSPIEFSDISSINLDLKNRGSYRIVGYFTIKASLNSIHKVNYIVESHPVSSGPPRVSSLPFTPEESSRVFQNANVSVPGVESGGLPPQTSIRGSNESGIRSRLENVSSKGPIASAGSAFSFGPLRTSTKGPISEEQKPGGDHPFMRFPGGTAELHNSAVSSRQSNGSNSEDDSESIQIDIWTDGSLSPRQALLNAFKKLFELFYNLSKSNYLKPIEI